MNQYRLREGRSKLSFHGILHSPYFLPRLEDISCVKMSDLRAVHIIRTSRGKELA